MKVGSIPSVYVNKPGLRFEGEYYLNENSYNSMIIETYPNRTTLESIAYVFNPSIFKRQFCKHTGNAVEYFQSSDVPNCSEISTIYVNKSQAESLNLLVKKDDILVTGFGTIGNTRLVTKHQNNVCYANNVCRVRCKEGQYIGFIYAFMSSKYGKAQLNKNASGSVVRYIESPGIKKTIIPSFPEDFQNKINDLVLESVRLREEATDMLSAAERILKESANLRNLNPEDYDYFGARSSDRKVSCFVINRKDITTTTINAFNLSERIRKTKESVTCPIKSLREVLLSGDTFSTGSFPRVEVKEGYGVMLINQKDIFDTIIKGKYISKRGIKTDNMVEYGEVLIAGVGTLGENETFCRVIFANEDLVGQLVSGEFIRMKVNKEIPSGYLYAWLSSDYGFRFLRNIQAGTKLCRPIPKLVLEIPVPFVSPDVIIKIDKLVKEAHTKRYKANDNEHKAILMVEQEIEKWNK